MLEIENLELNIHGATPLRDINLRVEEAQSVGIVGESGSGKSLTALSVMGLFPEGAKPSGRVLWRGENLLAATASRYRQIRGKEISMIFQDPMSALNPSYTIGYQIDEALHFKTAYKTIKKAERKKEGLELLSEVGISAPEERWNAYPHQISGGMAQRVSIAMALASHPKLLIADEPTTALDVTVQAQILSLLRKIILERKMAMMFVTHDLAVAKKICDKINVFYAGMTVETGSTCEVLENAQHPYTQALLRARPSGRNLTEKKELYAIPGHVPAAREKIKGCVFANRCESVMPKCWETVPPEFAVEKGHVSRCWLHETGQAGHRE